MICESCGKEYTSGIAPDGLCFDCWEKLYCRDPEPMPEFEPIVVDA
jgi:hypothetical protein